VTIFGKIIRVQSPGGASALFNRAVVLGGSIAGLVAARVLSGHARDVLIIERDEENHVGLPRARAAGTLSAPALRLARPVLYYEV
jgi:2-polyprenyl-6-methoxyphenol hydroxylase-like FAD-dependent oxidoreductase